MAERNRFKCSGGPDTLWHICFETFMPRRIQLRSKKTADQYGYALHRFGEFLGREPMLTDLDDDILSAWAKVMLADESQSVFTVRERLGRILTLWNWLAKRRIVEMFPTFQ